MAIKICSHLIIGNALIEAQDDIVTNDYIMEYWSKVDKLLPKRYYTYENSNYISQFCEIYPFFVSLTEEGMIIKNISKETKDIMIRYFRVGLPDDVVSAFINSKIEEEPKSKMKIIKK